LIAALRAHAQIPTDCDVMLGNGSDELISLLALACATPGATVLAPVPGFVMYEIAAKLQGLRFVGVPLTARFELDAQAMLDAIESHKPTLTYIAYPNNPTANLFDDAIIDKIIAAVRAQNGWVVFDEAYQPFSSRTWMQRMARHDHVLVMRTLSKFGLAGVRLGYLAGPKHLIHEIDKVRPPYNVSVLNTETALFALEHASEYARQAQILREQREYLLSEFSLLQQRVKGFEVFPSQANMILIRVADAAFTFEGLKQRGILVKNVSSLHPLLSNCLRLTVGTPQENALMLEALKLKP
jgi:histidinol-phosphate aminotransferase